MGRSRVAIAAALILVSAISPSLSQDISSVKATLAAKQCPPAEISLIDVVQRCGGIDYRRACDQKYSMSSGPWQECYHKQAVCQDQVSDDNQIIAESNRVYRLCRQSEAAGHDHPANTTPAKSGAALAKQVADAKQKAEEAKAQARQAVNQAQQAKKVTDEEKSRLKAQAITVPSWCQGMVKSCQQRATSLSNASSGTQSQCNAYCQILQVEDCNGASSTVQQAAQACNSGAQNDQRAALQRQRTAREQQAQRESEERRKWHCFGEVGNIQQGFRECQRECSAYFSASHCHDVCYASGDGSISNGRSCYREP